MIRVLLESLYTMEERRRLAAVKNKFNATAAQEGGEDLLSPSHSSLFVKYEVVRFF